MSKTDRDELLGPLKALIFVPFCFVTFFLILWPTYIAVFYAGKLKESGHEYWMLAVIGLGLYVTINNMVCWQWFIRQFRLKLYHGGTEDTERKILSKKQKERLLFKDKEYLAAYLKKNPLPAIGPYGAINAAGAGGAGGHGRPFGATGGPSGIGRVVLPHGPFIQPINDEKENPGSPAAYNATKEAPKLYDTVRLEDGEYYHNITFFTIPRGHYLADGTHKTYTHTNLDTPTVLPGMTKFTIKEIQIVPNRELFDTQRTFEKKKFLEGNAVLFINEKPYPSFLPIKNFLDGFKIPAGIEIRTFDAFRIAIYWDTGFCPDETLDLVANLYGIMKREVPNCKGLYEKI